jgi:hypothetical protein
MASIILSLEATVYLASDGQFIIAVEAGPFLGALARSEPTLQLRRQG